VAVRAGIVEDEPVTILYFRQKALDGELIIILAQRPTTSTGLDGSALPYTSM
jgi:hypothetical protein